MILDGYDDTTMVMIMVVTQLEPKQVAELWMWPGSGVPCHAPLLNKGENQNSVEASLVLVRFWRVTSKALSFNLSKTFEFLPKFNRPAGWPTRNAGKWGGGMAQITSTPNHLGAY